MTVDHVRFELTKCIPKPSCNPGQMGWTQHFDSKAFCYQLFSDGPQSQVGKNTRFVAAFSLPSAKWSHDCLRGTNFHAIDNMCNLHFLIIQIDWI